MHRVKFLKHHVCITTINYLILRYYFTVLTVCFASLFLIIESSRNSYHSQKLSDLPKIELAWKLIRGVGRKQISKMSWFLLAGYVTALLLNSFLTTILNSRTAYTTEFIVGNAASYYVDPISLNQTMDIGQQCADVSGEIMPVECLYANLAGIYYLNANNASNSVGLIGSQYEQMNGEYAYSATAPNIGVMEVEPLQASLRQQAQ